MNDEDIKKFVHDIRNSATILSGYIQMLEMKRVEDPDEKRWIEELGKENQRMVKLLYDFSAKLKRE